MADHYPRYPALPAEWLVAAQDQPDYLEPPGIVLDETVDLGAALSDAHAARGAADDIAIIHHETGEEITFRELAERSDRLADALVSLGIGPGARVAIRSPNRPEGIVASIAVWKIGAVVVPIPYIARAAELDFYIADTEPSAFVTYVDGAEMVVDRASAAGISRVIVFGAEVAVAGTMGWGELLRTAPKRESRAAVPLDSVAIVWHTGGTTGVPKGCYHTQRRYLLAGRSYGAATGSAPGQRWAAAAPIGHALGMIYHTIFTLLHGATIVLIETFTDPRVLLAAIDQHGITTFTAIAASWAGMNSAIERGEAAAPRTLRRAYAMWQSSSSSEVVDGWKSRGVTLLNNFGSTAFANWVLIPRAGETVPQGSLGRAAPGYEVRAVDPSSGEIAAPGTPGQMTVRGVSGLTYWRLPEKQRADVRDGWIFVDDLIQDSGSGNFDYLGRTDFLISTAGYKVAPAEVENVLVHHPAVKEVVVIGLPDSLRQEAVAAFVVLADGVSGSDELRKQLQDLVKTQLSPYKYPRILEFLSELPRDHVGKVQPQRVRERALAERGVA